MIVKMFHIYLRKYKNTPTAGENLLKFQILKEFVVYEKLSIFFNLFQNFLVFSR